MYQSVRDLISGEVLSDQIRRSDDGMLIRADPLSAQWQAYEIWRSKGNEPASMPPAAPPPLPDISDRQFGEGLWRDGLISYEDYLAFVGPGTIPPPLQAIIDTLPDDDTGQPTERKIARGLVTGAQSYRFDNPFVDVIRQAQGWTVDHLREQWLEWSKL